MKNLLFLSILICMGCLRLIAQAGVSPLDPSHQPRFCSLLNPRSNPAGRVDDSALINAYNLQAHLIRSLRLIAVVRGKAGKEYGVGERPRELPAVIDFVQPDLVHVTGGVPFLGSREFEMASDGHEFRLLVPQNGKKTFLVGPIDAPVKSQNARDDLRPEPLINALHWQEGRLIAGARLQGVHDANLRELKVDLLYSKAPGRTAKIEFDLLHGQVDSVETYDAAGQLVSKTSYSDWQEAANSASSPSQGCLPHRIEFLQPKQDYEVTLRVSHIALNPEIPRANFHPAPPRGIPVVHLDKSGRAITN
ncbi:hypothetical protein [Terracidiphilus sp.]|jgi:hypothetical protein|uniref:hypothetical protein n=1 Tax=Terracidiphilus sp. TaxID=1964191 RepID=UPI003C19FA1E